MSFGLNLSFCVKRWVTPALWAPLLREMGVGLAQFSLDLIDPLWPDALLDRLADELRTGAEGITLHSAFIGLAHYTHCQLLHPDPAVRDAAEDWLGRAYRFAARAGIPAVGGPLGAVAARLDGHEPDAIPPADYADLLARLHRLALRAAGEGLRALYVEPTPLRREWPWTIAQAQRLAADLTGSDLPWRWCLDWGHATFAPLYGEGAGMADWLTALGGQTGLLHIQQTDGKADRHWDFTADGIIDARAAAAQLAALGLAGRPVFLEAFYPFELADARVLDGIRRSVAVLQPVFT